jgi:TrmH family RNA methyltransferase
MMSQRVLAWRTAIRGAARASNPGAARCVSPGASAARCVGGGGGRHVGTSRASNARAPWTAIVSPRSQRSPRRDVCAGAGAARGDAAERVTSTDNATVKHFAKLVKNRAHREQSGSVVVAGAGLLEEIYGAPDGTTLPEVKVMFLADDAPVPSGVPARRVVRAPEHVLKKAAGLQSVDRVDAVAELAAPNLDGAAALGTTDVTRLLALDGIQDPGNLGTLVRTALALGWDAVALLPGTCDPFNDKARPPRFPVSRSPRTRARTAPVSRLSREFYPRSCTIIVTPLGWVRAP